MPKILTVILLMATIAEFPVLAYSKGCLKGAAVGAVAGHVAGHHAVAGAAVGCAVGHHEAAVKNREAKQKAAAPAPKAPGANSSNTPST